MKIRGRRVVVERDPEQESYGSIVIPEQCRDNPLTGVVRYVGEGTEVQVGDRVLLDPWSFTPFPDAGERCVLVWDRDIMAVLS